MGISGSTVRKALFALLLVHGSAFAIDNPDAPDYVAAFEQRMQPLYTNVRDRARTTADYVDGYVRLEKRLDVELNAAYDGLLSKLDAPGRRRLQASQRAWLAFRDAEFAFIDGTWNAENFGTSSAISRGDYRTTIVKNRIIELLWYRKNF